MTGLISTSDPLKWTKYLMLVDFGFITGAELDQEIQRYRRGAEQQLMRDIAADLRAERERKRRNLYVIKLVSSGLPGRLPNCRVECPSDLAKVTRFFAEHENGHHVEVWFCRTRVDEQIFSVAGRFVFTHEDSERTQAVEQVWRCSPRLLETMGGPLQYPYMRASRHLWGWPYTIEDVRIPRRYDLRREKVVDEFRESMRLFEGERESIETFLSFLDSFTLGAYSLEYKIVGSKVTIIDWDTPNDSLVIANRARLLSA